MYKKFYDKYDETTYKEVYERYINNEKFKEKQNLFIVLLIMINM